MTTPMSIPFVLLLSAVTAAQVIHKVPQDFATIQAAVDAAADGDTVLISGGTYPEAVTVSGKHDLLIRGKGKVVIEPGSAIGLALTDCGNCTVEKIRVSGGQPAAFQLESTTDCTFTKCRSDDAVAAGLRLEGGGNCHFEKLRINQAGGNAIELTTDGVASTHDNQFAKCRVEACVVDGALVEGHHNTFDHCTFLKAGSVGCNVADIVNAHDNVFTACKVVKAGDSAFFVEGDDNTFTDCKIVQSGDDGAEIIDGEDTVFEGCKFTKVAGKALFAAAEAAGVTVSGCKISKSENDGIDMEGPTAHVEDNKVTATGADGIEIDGNDGTYTGNKVNGCQIDGIVISAGTGNTLTFNKAHGNKGFDFDDTVGGGLNFADETNSFGTTGP